LLSQCMDRTNPLYRPNNRCTQHPCKTCTWPICF
jgi:hypothetical protein